MDKKHLEKYRKKLHDKRQEIMKDFQNNINYRRESVADDGTQDIADKANMAYNKEFIFSLTDAERDLLQSIEEALSRVEESEFGSCTSCGNEIKTARLEAVPWAKYCLNCQELREQGLLD